MAHGELGGVLVCILRSEGRALYRSLSIPTFRPRAIVAEVEHAPPGLSTRLNTTLLDAGYITEMADSRNLFAWK